MEFYFNSSYTFVLGLLSLFLAAVISFVLYRKSKKNTPLSTNQIYFLSTLRFITVFLITFLFLDIAIQRITHLKVRPYLVIGIDNSESLSPHKRKMLQLVDRLRDELSQYNPSVLVFDSETTTSDSINLKGKRSNYSSLLQTIDKSYIPSTLGGVIIVGDGIFNTGIDPAFAASETSYAIYTIGVGDTTIHTDAAIESVNVNTAAYLNENFPVEIDLGFTKASGQVTNLAISQTDKVLYTRAIRIQSDDFFQTENLTLKPAKEGINTYVARIETLNGETNLANNRYEFSVNVISEKQKILVLAHGPHPDLGAINEALKGINKYEIEILSSLPDNLDFTQYSLVIVHQLPDASSQSSKVILNLRDSRRPVLFIIGSKTSLPQFNNLQAGLQIQANKSFEQVIPHINENFSLFRFSPAQMNELQSFPPLLTPFGDSSFEPELELFATQKIQAITTEQPLIAFGKLNGQKKGFILGEGLWRWRIHDYLNNQSHSVFDEFIRKSINYLVLKANEDNFNLFFKTKYAEDEDVIIQAELFNESFEPINSPDVEIRLTHESGQSYDAVFDRVNSQYQLNVGRLASGQYTFYAQTRLGEKDYAEKGSFSVNKIQIETVETEANFQVLTQMANKTGGKFYLPEQLDELINDLKSSRKLETIELKQEIYKQLLSMKWVFFVILFLLALEWFLRKYWGIY